MAKKNLLHKFQFKSNYFLIFVFIIYSTKFYLLRPKYFCVGSKLTKSAANSLPLFSLSLSLSLSQCVYFNTRSYAFNAEIVRG